MDIKMDIKMFGNQPSLFKMDIKSQLVLKWGRSTSNMDHSVPAIVRIFTKVKVFLIHVHVEPISGSRLYFFSGIGGWILAGFTNHVFH
jgi:hypothetical protein